MDDEGKSSIANQLTGLWAAFFLGLIVLYYKALTSQAPAMETSRGFFMVYELLFFSVAQTVFLVVYDLRYISRPHRTKVSVDANEAPEVVEMLIKASKAEDMFRAFLISCAVAEASGGYAMVLSFLGMPKYFIHIFMAFAFAGLIYVGLRMRLCWTRIYLN
jgi:hypothetical protein